MNEYIKKLYSSRNYKHCLDRGRSEWRQEQYRIQSKIRDEYDKNIRYTEKKAFEDAVEISIKELGTQEDYAREYAEEYFGPPITLGLLLSIRDIADTI